MSFFTILFFFLCLWFTTYTYKHEHAYKSLQFPPNPCNLFFDISRFESFHLFPSSTLSVSPHLLLFMNSSIRLRPSWWCWAESWPFCSELYSLEYLINLELAEIFFTPQLSCWSSHGNSHTQWNMAPTNWLWQFCLISDTCWLFNLALSSSHWSRWWSCSHFSIIPEIQTFPHSQLTST